MEKCETCGQLISKYDVLDADIDINCIIWVDRKVEFTLDRLTRFRKWQPGTKWEYLKQQCISKLKDQFEFLLRVQGIKEEEREANAKKARKAKLKKEREALILDVKLPADLAKSHVEVFAKQALIECERKLK